MRTGALRAKLAAAAQKVYDDWSQAERTDPDWFAEEYAGGGICHLIADEFCGVLEMEGYPSRTVSDSMSDAGVHVYAAFECDGSYYRADIPYFVYEKGFAYSFKRIPDVQFDASDVIIDGLGWSKDDFEGEDP